MDLNTLMEQISDCLLPDQAALSRRVRALQRRMLENKPVDRGISELLAEIESSRQFKLQRILQCPKPEYAGEAATLPVVEKRELIREAITVNQVVILCGETGSGKTTQLPKICLELGRGIAGLIGHTQPRRIAARALSARIADELNVEVGKAVGFKVRFSDHVSRETYIKVMTDGILLAETQGDPELLAYDTLIIDEAHERSLNIDFLLGYIKKLLPKRPDLKIIITSATIDPERFSRHFDNAPIIEVSGRSYPVEVLYRPLRGETDDERDRDRGQALLDAVDELTRYGPGDILVFLPGERDIRDAADLLRKHHPPQTEILPLYGRLSAEQQNAVFKSHPGRRIVLATNVAETSLTVPGIHYVVDTGLARISRYSYRTKVQRLPIEPISQASAQQRAGRCGRIAPGICIRLYSEEDFQQRPEFTEPEILRTSLADVILRMLDLKLGDIGKFPFIEPPDERFVRDGFRLLFELQAVDEHNRITALGRRLAKLPIDVRLGRMILAASGKRCLNDVLIIVAALSIQDPRERPMEAQQAADEKHATFADKRSDFIAYLNLWNFYKEKSQQLSQSGLRKLCRENFLSYVRMREWHEIFRQLKTLLKGMDEGSPLVQSSAPEEPDYNGIHQALLTGLLGNIAFKSEEREYSGARNLKISVFPGSGLFKVLPKWIVAAELVETGKRYGRTVARIEPEWIEQLAQHLVSRVYLDPHWDTRNGYASAFEQVSLYGLVLVQRRKVDYSAVDPKHARKLMIRGGLIGGVMQRERDKSGGTPSEKYTHHKTPDFIEHNLLLVDTILALEAKSRRQDILAGEDVLFDFYAALVPADINRMRDFENWYDKLPDIERRRFFASRGLLMLHPAEGVTTDLYPDILQIQGMLLPLRYLFEPGHPDDGVTAKIPLAALNQVQAATFEWLVPGLLTEKITQLIKALPKTLRRRFVPAPDYARQCAQLMSPYTAPLIESLAETLQRLTGDAVPAHCGDDGWRTDVLPPYLLMNFHIVRPDGKIIAQGRDLQMLQATIGKTAEASFGGLPVAKYERTNIETWDFGDLPDEIEIEQQGIKLKGYPALAYENKQINLRLFDAAAKAATSHREGVLRLFYKHAAKSFRYLEKNLPDIQALCLYYLSLGDCEKLKQDLVGAIAATALFEKNAAIRRQDDFIREADWAEKQLQSLANRVCRHIGDALKIYHQVQKRIKGNISPLWIASLSDIRQQLDLLIYPGFVSSTPPECLPHLPRYLRGIEIRLEKLAENPKRDLQLNAEITPLWEKYLRRCEAEKNSYPPACALSHADRPNRELQNFRWLLEELRVSLFAQQLGAAETVSIKRLEKIWKGIL